MNIQEIFTFRNLAQLWIVALIAFFLLLVVVLIRKRRTVPGKPNNAPGVNGTNKNEKEEPIETNGPVIGESTQEKENQDRLVNELEEPMPVETNGPVDDGSTQEIGNQDRPVNKDKEDPKPAKAYESSLTYFLDELKLLDKLLRLRFRQWTRRRNTSSLDPFKGVVITEAEISNLLEDQPEAHDSDNIRALEQEISASKNHIKTRRNKTSADGRYLSSDRLAKVFGLSEFEERCVITCLALELDHKYERIYAYLQDDVTLKKPTGDFLLKLYLSSREERLAFRSEFGPAAPLMKFRLLKMEEDSEGLSLSRMLQLDSQIVNFLLDEKELDSRFSGIVQLLFPTEEQSETFHERERKQLGEFLLTRLSKSAENRKKILIQISGTFGSGKRKTVEMVCRDLQLPLLVVDADKLVDSSLPFEEIIWLIARQMCLEKAILCIDHFEAIQKMEQHSIRLKRMFAILEEFGGVIFLLNEQKWNAKDVVQGFIYNELHFPNPDPKQRKFYWTSCAAHGSYPIAKNVDLGPIASKFSFTSGQIQKVLSLAYDIAVWRSQGEPAIEMSDLYEACRRYSTPNLGALANRIEPKHVWDDLILPSDQLAQLEEICKQAEFKDVVFSDWEFEKKLSMGKGLNVLFSGPSGTGKTMAAEIIAAKLQLDIFRIDLSQVVSKYIGETEKILSQIFHEASTSGAILFFDEADALFGKRTDIKDSHDRYANIEVGHLLQKMEEYEERIAILATNLRQNMDEAFVRRMNFIVEFPFPEEEYRLRIWKDIFPKNSPLKDIDFTLLAKEAKISGGNIKNIAIAAAFHAAAEESDIQMRHVLHAVRREYQKMGRLWKEWEWSKKEAKVS